MENGKDILVEVSGVSKKFSRSLRRSLAYGMREVVSTMFGIKSERGKLREDEFWAVQDISFTLRRGECLGLIGRNGAGKSTLLKMLNGLILPDQGSIVMRGKISALIELGAGFNPLLSGRENIYINGQLLGFTRKEIEAKLQSIIDFSEIESFIDSPVQNYSSGMKVRLGFAVAAHMEPDVLIIDEVLAVGDLGFVLKCFNRIDKMLKNTAVIFVSHSMQQVSRICTHVIMMNKGAAVFDSSDVSAGIDHYYSMFNVQKGRSVVFNRNDDAELVRISLGNDREQDGTEMYKINRLSDLEIYFALKVRKSVGNPHVIITIYDKEQKPVGIAQCEDGLQNVNAENADSDYLLYTFKTVVPRINLSKGVYLITFSVTENFGSQPILRIHSATSFQVVSKNDIWPPIEFESAWVPMKTGGNQS